MNTFLNHLKFACRNIFRNRIYSLFNIVGFALGFTICIISGLYIYREFNVDKNFKDYRNIYRIVDDENNISQIDYDLAEKFRNRFPEITYAAPVLFDYTHGLLIKASQDENYISVQNVINTESQFFQIFSFDFIIGNPSNPFNSELSVVVTRSVAERLFGHTHIVGEMITMIGGIHIPVSAVIEDMPDNFSMKAEIIINSETGTRFLNICRNGNEICYNPYPIYAMVNSGTDIKSLEEKINNNFPENLSETTKIRLQPLTDIYFDKTVTDSHNLPGNRSLVFIFITIALTVLMLSVINYVNFALSQQLDTLKQSGIKITYGASIKQLKLYYLVEIGLSIILSFILSVGIGIYFLPLFNHVLGVHLNINELLTPVFILSVIFILVLVILISSFTPFYIISKFDVQMLFGKKQTYFGKQRGKMILTGCQMAITIVMFICLFMIQKQLNYVKNYDLGFDKNYLVKIEIPPQGFEAFRNEITSYDFVLHTAYSGGAPGFSYFTEEQQNEQDNRYVMVHKIYAEPNFIQTFHIELLQGRNFTHSDRGNSCIVSEETMAQMGWETIEGKKCNGYQVIGVVKNFNISSLHHRVEPVNIIYANEGKGPINFLNIRLNGDVQEALAQLRRSWKNVFSDAPFNYQFYKETFDSYYKKEERQSTAIAIISFIAIIITCMGLVGQVKQVSLSKAKEIGIRKINGATVTEIMLVIPKSFWQSFVVAFIFAIPIAWIAMNKWLGHFAFKTAISWWIFVLSGLAVFLILTLLIVWQTWKAATVNPVEIIKAE